jgi:LmbE family N-acetylglucosaminyl deacetylase
VSEPGRACRLRAGRWIARRRLLFVVIAFLSLFVAYGQLAGYQAWRKALRQQGFIDEMAVPEEEDRILVIAPHPDDEMLGCGGLIQQSLANGARVDVALMTNGDASELSVIFGERELIVSPPAMIELGRTRQEESLRALAEIGLPKSRVHFLSYPNNGITQLWRTAHWLYLDAYTSPYTRAALSPYRRSLTPQAPYCGQQALSDLIAILQQVRPTKVFVTHPKDIHPDHWATDCFVRYALATIVARDGDWAKEVEVYGYLIHWSRFPAPAKLSLTTDLLPPADLVGRDARWLRLPLSREMARRKLAGIRDYRSQMPGYDRLLLSFARANEVFELLPTEQLTPGVAQRWEDRGRARRALAGANLQEVALTLTTNGTVRAKLLSGNHKMGRYSYLGLDLRTWDEHGAPVITELQVENGASVEATHVAGARLQSLGKSVRVGQLGDGYSITLPVPAEIEERKSFFLSCWGSVRDRTVDSAVVAPLHVSPAPE